MNTPFILSNLKEAEEELRRLISEIETGNDFSFEEYHVAMAHLYLHLNSAWNGRNVTRQEWQECSTGNFKKWRKFPRDLYLIGDDECFDLPEYKDDGTKPN